MDKATARKLRSIARDFERTGKSLGTDAGFTCNAVEVQLGRTVQYMYNTLFNMEARPNALWRLPEPEQRDVRVMMLCFAAAMAETGDL